MVEERLVLGANWLNEFDGAALTVGFEVKMMLEEKIHLLMMNMKHVQK